MSDSKRCGEDMARWARELPPRCLDLAEAWRRHDCRGPELLLGEDVGELLAATEREPSRNLGAALAP